MADPITINALQQTGRLTELDPKTGKVFSSLNLDFDAAANYVIDFSTQSQGQVFGACKCMFLDNSSNPNTVEVLVQGTDQFFIVPANSVGFYQIDATPASRISIITDGGATDKATATFYNWERAPVVWYSFGPFNSNIPVMTYGAMAEGSDVATDPYNKPLFIGGIDRATGEFRGVAVDADGRLDFSSSITIGAVTIANGADVTQGAIADAANIDPATSGTIVAFTKGILNRIIALLAKVGGGSTGTVTSVASAITDTTILAANANRKGATIYNNSTSILYIALANVDATLSWSVILFPGGILSVSNNDYTGAIKGVWATVDGTAQVTEFT